MLVFNIIFAILSFSKVKLEAAVSHPLSIIFIKSFILRRGEVILPVSNLSFAKKPGHICLKSIRKSTEIVSKSCLAHFFERALLCNALYDVFFQIFA